jgi:hypothetical protein
MNIEEKDDIQDVDTSLLPDFDLLGLDEENKNQEENEQEEEDTDTSEEAEEPKQDNEETEKSSEESEEGLESIRVFYDMFKEQGILPEKDVNSLEDLTSEIDKYKNELPNQVRDAIINDAPEVSRNVLDFAMTKPNVTREDIINFLSAEAEDQKINSIETDEQAREFLEAEYTKLIGDDTAAKTAVDALEDKGQLQEKAKSMFQDRAAKLQEQAIQEREQQEAAQLQFYNDIEAQFESQTWKEDHKNKVVESWKQGSFVDVINDIKSKPKALVQLMNILSYYNSDEQEFNMDTFFTKASTKKVNDVRDRIISSAQKKFFNSKSKTKGNQV